MRRDIYHDMVVHLLQADNWIITDDPLTLSFGGRDLYTDLGAEKPIGAEKNGLKIAVEIKTFLNPSDVQDLKLAVGQYNIYQAILEKIEPERWLYLAIPQRAYEGIFLEPLGQLMIGREQIRLLVFDEIEGEVVQWIPLLTTKP